MANTPLSTFPSAGAPKGIRTPDLTDSISESSASNGDDEAMGMETGVQSRDVSVPEREQLAGRATLAEVRKSGWFEEPDGGHDAFQRDLRAGSVVATRPPARAEEGGAIPTSALQPKNLWVREVPWYVAKAFVREYHYLRTTPARRSGVFLGVFDSPEPFARLIGVMVWMYPTAMNRLAHGKETLELRRMILLDVTAPNAESRVLGIAARHIKRVRPDIHYLLSYSDLEGMGHKGTIYKAAGWQLDAVTTPISWKNRPGRLNKGSATSKLRWRKVLS